MRADQLFEPGSDRLEAAQGARLMSLPSKVVDGVVTYVYESD